MRLSILAVTATFLLIVCPSYSVTAQDLVAAEQAAREYAKSRVFTITTNKERGTAVLLKEDDGKFGYFATCYHVLHNVNAFTIYSAIEGNKVADSTQSQILVRRSLDLVLIKVHLPLKGEIKPLNRLDEKGMASDDDRNPIDGFVFGMAGFQTRQLFTTGVRIQQIQWANLLKGVIDTDLLNPGDPRLEVRFLGREITYAGMSGGLVVDRDQRFAGLLLGRMPEPNAIPLMITARQVKDSLDHAGEIGWSPFDPKEFTAPPPYEKNVLKQMTAPWPVSEIEWNSYESWVRAFESDPLQFLEAFQEIRLDLNILQSFIHNPKNQNADKFQVQLRENQNVRLLLNGVPLKQGETIPLQRGENLLIISKLPTGGSGFDLTDLFRQNSIDATFHLGEQAETVFHLKRSLPRLIQGYSLYVTIQNGPPDPGPNYMARLAVPLDYLEEVINQIPFSLPFGDREVRSGTEFLGVARLGDQKVKLTYASAQTVDVTANFEIDVKTAQANFAGIRLSGKSKKAKITMTGRVQFPASSRSLFFVCARAMAASGPEKQFLLPLSSDELIIDASGLIRELLVCYANIRLLRPDAPRTPGPDDILRILRNSGLASKSDEWRLVPARIQLVPDDRKGQAKKAWVVITFQLRHKGNTVEIRDPPPLLPDAAIRDTLAGEFVTADLPSQGLTALHPSIVDPTGLSRVFSVGTDAPGPLRLRLTVDRANLARQKELPLSGNAAELPDELGRVATAGLSRSRVTGEVRWKSWNSPGQADVKDICLAVTFTPALATQEQLTGTFSAKQAEMKIANQKFLLSGFQGTFRLTIDPKSADKALHFKIATLKGKYDFGAAKMQDLPNFEFDVWVSRDFKKISHNFGDEFLFGKRRK